MRRLAAAVSAETMHELAWFRPAGRANALRLFSSVIPKLLST